MNPKHLKRTLYDLLASPQSRAATLAALHELAPLGYDPLRLACLELLDARQAARLSPLARRALSLPCAPPPALAPPLPAPCPLSEELSLLDQLDALLTDLELLLPLKSHISGPERLRRALMVAAVRPWVARAREGREARAARVLAAASRLLGDLVLTRPERWADEGFDLLALALAPLAAGGGEQGEGGWTLDERLEQEEVAELLSRPSMWGLLRRTCAPRAPLEPHTDERHARWRARLAGRVPDERLEEACHIAARAACTDVREVEGVEFELAHCPPAEIWVGADDQYNKSAPRHRVRVTRGFWIGRTTVTQALWERVMGSNPSDPRDPHLPAVRVTWYECVRFCNKLSALEGLPPAYELGEGARPTVRLNLNATGYRLPTEAEWELAAKAGAETRYAGSDQLSEVARYGRRDEQGAISSESGLRRAAQLSPNPYGLYDMSGNVWEWCSDEWTHSYREPPHTPHRAVTDPAHLPLKPFRRVSRGGAWDSGAVTCCVAYRDERACASRYPSQGLRLCRSLEPSTPHPQEH